MKEELIQRRNYRDTFAGGRNRQDMEQNLSAVSPAHRYDYDWEPFPVKADRRAELQKRVQEYFR